MFMQWVSGNLSNLIGSIFVCFGLGVFYIVGCIFLNKKVKSPYKTKWKNQLLYLFVLLGIVIIGEIWFETFRIFTALASLIGAALIVIHKELILNLTAAFFIKVKKLFKIGDHISIKGISGEVISIGWQSIVIFSKSGIQHGYSKVPNHFIFNHEVVNYSEPMGYLSISFSAYIAPRSNPVHAKKCLQEIIYKHTHNVYLELGSNDKNRLSAKRLPEVFISTHENELYCFRLDSMFYYYPGGKKKIIDAITQDWIMAVQSSSDIWFPSP